MDNADLIGKISILLELLQLCGDEKIVVFSQSITTLDLIEMFLLNGSIPGRAFIRDKHYYRLDGSTTTGKRDHDINAFNDVNERFSFLFLISTKAGGLGVNLCGANRAVLFDLSWNPSYDTQALFRIYRIGQTKPVYIYRFVAQV